VGIKPQRTQRTQRGSSRAGTEARPWKDKRSGPGAWSLCLPLCSSVSSVVVQAWGAEPGIRTGCVGLVNELPNGVGAKPQPRMNGNERESAQLPFGMKPGIPVFTTALNLCLVWISLILSKAVFGMAQMLKFSRARAGVLGVVRTAVPR